MPVVRKYDGICFDFSALKTSLTVLLLSIPVDPQYTTF